MLKNKTYFLFLLLSIFIISCSVEPTEINEPSNEIELRSDELLSVAAKGKCCDGVSFFVDLVDTDNCCCIYKVAISNNGECPVRLVNGKGNTLITVNGGFSVVHQIKVCEAANRNAPCDFNEEVFSIMSGFNVCDTFTLTNDCPPVECDCDDITNDFSYNVESTSVSDEDCCEGELEDAKCCVWEISFTNDTDCDVNLLGPKGVIQVVFPAGDSGTVSYTRCSEVVPLGHNLSFSDGNSTICEPIDLPDCSQ